MAEQHTPPPGAHDAHTAGQPISILWEYLGILRRRVWVILPIVIIASTIGLIKAFQTPRIYRATTRMLVERQAPNVMKFGADSQEGESYDPDFYSTQTELIRSRAVMDTALREPGVSKLFSSGEQTASQSSWAGELKRTLLAALGAEPAPPPEAWVLLRDKVVAIHLKDSHFMTIDALDGEPNAAADIANAAARAYQEYHRERKIGQLGVAFSLLEKERNKEEADLLEAEKALQAFRERARSVTVNSAEDQPAIERLEKLNEQLTDVQLKRIELSSQIGVMKQALDSDTQVGEAINERLFTIPVIQTDLGLSETRKALADAEKDIAVLAQTYGLRHPRYQAAQTNVTLLRQQFKAALREITSSHDNRLEMLKNQETEIQKTYEEQKLTALELAKESFEYTRLKNAADRHRELFDSIVERMREVDVTSNLAQTNIQIIEKASPPLSPVNQGRFRKVLASAFFGFLFGAMLALMFESLDDTIKTPEDIKSRLRAPFLGFIPAVQPETAAGEEGKEPPPPPDLKQRALTAYQQSLKLARQRLGIYFPKLALPEDLNENRGTPEERAYRGTLVLSEPMSSIAEAYRGIRASLFYSIPAEEIKTLSMTSSRPQEGKTTTSCNLALSIAQTGKRVLLIDGDLHRPSVNTVLNLENKVGLTSVLVGQSTFEAALQKIVHNGKTVEHLDILAAGPSTPNPSELLGSNVMRDLLAAARKAYDWVLVDTPPILFVSDAGILSTMCDGVIIVVRSGNSTRSLLNRTTEQLAGLKARIIGSILNGVVVARMGRYYSSYYSYGYARYAKEYQRTYYSGEEGTAGSEAAEETAQRRELPRGVPASTVTPSGPTPASVVSAAIAAAASPAPIAIPPPPAVTAKTPDAPAPEIDRTRARELQSRLIRAEQETQQASAEREVERQSIARVRAELEEARHTIRELEALHPQATLAAKTAEAQLQDLRIEHEALRREIEAERGARRRADQRSAELEHRLAKQPAPTAQAPSAGLAALEVQLAEARREIDALAGARADRDAALQRAESQAAQWQQRAKSTESLVEETKRQLAGKQTAHDTFAAEVEDAKRQLAEERTRADRLATDLAKQEQDANRKLDELAARLDDAHKQAKAVPVAPTPQVVQETLRRADSYLSTGNYTEARSVLRTLVESAPGVDEAWEFLLDTLLLGHDQAELTEWLRRFPEQYGLPTHVPSLAEGHRALLQNNSDLALQYYESALKERKSGRAAQEGVLRAAIQKGDTDLVRARIQRLLWTHRQSAYAHYVVAYLYVLDNKPARAEKALRKSLGLRKTPEALMDLAWLLSERREHDEAEQLARAASVLYPIIPTAWETLGVILTRAQRYAEAERALQRAHALAPGSTSTMLYLAELYLRQGNKNASMELGARLAGMQGRLTPPEVARLSALRAKLA